MSQTNPILPTEEKKETKFRKICREAFSAGCGGIIHAFIEQPITTPVEASITQTQVNGITKSLTLFSPILGRNFFTNFGDLFKQRALYRSLPTALIGAIPKAMIHYSILTFYINMLCPDGNMKNASPKTATLVGFVTGGSEVILVNPINFLKFRMQRPEWGYTGMIDAIKTVNRKEGFFAFWKGCGATFLRNSICMSGMVGTYRYIKNILPMKDSKPKDVTAGAIGGLFGSFFSYPFEMLRAAKMHNVPFMEEIWNKGAKRILAGWPPGACRLIVTSAIMGLLIPMMKDISGTFRKKK